MGRRVSASSLPRLAADELIGLALHEVLLLVAVLVAGFPVET